MNYELRIKKSRNAGYTIIETMISVSLFTVIVTIALGSLLNANLLHRKSQNMRSILDNLSFTMEDMSRNLRVGYNYYCIPASLVFPSSGSTLSGSNCPGIAFVPVSGGSSEWAYEIVTANGGSTYYIRRSTDGGATWVQLTPDEINVNSISSFTIIGAEPPPGNSRQPFVTIKLVGSITTSNGGTSPFSLQTSVSQRKIDI